MADKAAHIITAVFHPLLIPTYAFIILLHMQVYFVRIIPEQSKWIIIGMIFFATFIFPMLFYIALYYRGVIKSMHMRSKEERTIPYIIAIIFFYLTFYILRRMGISPFFYHYMGGATLLLVLVLVINLFWKISSHTIAFGALLGGIVALSLLMNINVHYLLLPAVLIGSFIASSRLRLNAHTQAQIYAGLLLGVGVMLGMLLFLS